jgi:NAD(P)-dependent dehydrogenase (short-subunit alcohol dehydrogenase family)
LTRQLIGANVTAIQAGRVELEDLDRIANVVRSTKGKVDVVASNAAVVEQVPLPEITPDHYDRGFALNAKAPLFLVPCSSLVYKIPRSWRRPSSLPRTRARS